MAKKNVGFTPAQMSEFHDWIKKNTTDKGLLASNPMTAQHLAEAFPELGKSKREREFYAKQIVVKYNAKQRNKEVSKTGKSRTRKPFKIKWLGMLSKITLNDEKYKDRVFDLNDPDDASVYISEMYNMYDHQELGWIETEDRFKKILNSIYPNIKFDAKFDGMGFYHVIGIADTLRMPRAGRVEDIAIWTVKMNARNDPKLVKFLGKETRTKNASTKNKYFVIEPKALGIVVQYVDREGVLDTHRWEVSKASSGVLGRYGTKKEAFDFVNEWLSSSGYKEYVKKGTKRVKKVLNAKQEAAGLKIINAWRSGMIEFADERDLLLSREGLKPEDFGYTPFSSGKKSRPSPKCRKVVKKWVDGKLKIVTKIYGVKFAHETAGSLRISFIDVEGSSITLRIKRESRAKYKIEPYLKGRKLVESVPKYPQTFSFDGKALVGLWISANNAHESPLSELEVQTSISGESGVTTKYTIDNPRILDTIPVC